MRSSGLAGIIFHLRLEGEKRIRMICFFTCFDLRQTGSFSVTDPFLTFYYVEKGNGILRKNRGKGFEKSYVPLYGVRGIKNFQNHPYVINEWPLIGVCIIITVFLIRNFKINWRKFMNSLFTILLKLNVSHYLHLLSY